MADPDVVVVGGGIAGLTCAAFLAKQGLDVTLLERDDRLGGLARSVKVDDWLIPANFGRTDGFHQGDPKTRILEHLGLLERLRPTPCDTVCELRIDDFRLTVPAGFEAAREAFVAAFPADERGVRRALGSFERLADEVERLADDSRSAALRFLAFPFFYPSIFRLRGRTCAELLRSRLRDPRARVALGAFARLIGTSPADVGAMACALAATAALRRPIAVPGGGRSLAQGLADVAREAGAEVRTKTPVTSIWTDGRSLRGVRTAAGELRAKVVVLNAPALVAFGSLVGRDAVHAGYLQRLGLMKPSASASVLLLAVRAPRAELAATSDLILIHAGDDAEAHVAAIDEDSVAGRTMTVALHPPAPGADAPSDVTLLTAAVPDRIARWAGADEVRRAEQAEEARSSMLARLGFLHPDLPARVAASRLLTPLDLSEWSGDPDASLYGWEPTPSQSGVQRLEQQTPVDGLLLAGAWTTPGGGYGNTMLSGFLAGLQSAMALGKRVRM
ncbi:MAG: NAD(P)/FAD-dependent oxidoreductase [Deltaproteobacteria bacterium]|nr:NAD(P)/FAD-dependent oxidoreductase [Deltaproteobacteria bacterium]